MKKEQVYLLVFIGTVVALFLFLMLMNFERASYSAIKDEISEFLKETLMKLKDGELNIYELIYKPFYMGDVDEGLAAYKVVFEGLGQDIRAFLGHELNISVDIKGLTRLNRDLIPKRLRPFVQDEYVFIWRYRVDNVEGPWVEGRVVKVEDRCYFGVVYSSDGGISVYPSF